jgi:putative ABC transport system substrate-binding protein
MGQFRRRHFLIAAGALTTAPLASFAQPAQKVRRIGFLAPFPAPPKPPDGPGTFRDALRRRGYEVGKNLVIEARWAAGNLERLAQLAEELVRLDVELIVSVSNDASDAARKATRSIPIVMWANTFPIERGLIASFARPGGNVTGTVWSMHPENALLKWFQLLKEAVPSARRSARIGATDSAYRFFDARAIERGIVALGMTHQRIPFIAPGDLDAVLEQLKTSRAEVFHVPGLTFIPSFYKQIAAFAIEHKMVSISDVASYARAGGCLSYGLDPRELIDQIASYVDRILRGAKPGDLAIEQPTKFLMTLNASTARAIGLKPPESFMLRVDQVIE